MKKYVKNPIEITAIQYQWDDVNLSIDEAQDKIADFVDQNIELQGEVILFYGVIGQVEVNRGDWVIKQNDTDFYPCSDKAFQQNYKAAPFTWLDRVKAELEEEQSRLDKLSHTLNQNKPDQISEDQWVFMSRQQFHMRMTCQILQQRIDLAEGKTIAPAATRKIHLQGSEDLT